MPAPAKRSAPSASSRRQRTPKREQHHAAANLAPQSEMQRVQIVADSAGRQLFDCDRGDDPRTELEHLQDAARRQVGAAQSGRETDEVFDPRRTARLPARSEPIEHQRRQPFGRRVHGRGEARRVRRRRSRNRPPAKGSASRCRPRWPVPARTDSEAPCPSPHSITGVFRGEPSA